MSNIFTVTTDDAVTTSTAIRTAPKINWASNTCFSTVSGKEALIQRCEKRLQTEINQYYAYPTDYGIKTYDLINKPLYYIKAVFPSRVKEAFANEEEIVSIDSFTYTQSDRSVIINISMTTTYGEATTSSTLTI